MESVFPHLGEAFHILKALHKEKEAAMEYLYLFCYTKNLKNENLKASHM